jgi:hypothetical protein
LAAVATKRRRTADAIFPYACGSHHRQMVDLLDRIICITLHRLAAVATKRRRTSDAIFPYACGSHHRQMVDLPD